MVAKANLIRVSLAAEARAADVELLVQQGYARQLVHLHAIRRRRSRHLDNCGRSASAIREPHQHDAGLARRLERGTAGRVSNPPNFAGELDFGAGQEPPVRPQDGQRGRLSGNQPLRKDDGRGRLLLSERRRRAKPVRLEKRNHGREMYTETQAIIPFPEIVGARAMQLKAPFRRGDPSAITEEKVSA